MTRTTWTTWTKRMTGMMGTKRMTGTNLVTFCDSEVLTVMKPEIRTHRDLQVYKLSFEAGMNIFELTKSFPKQETYSLIDQIRRSSRSVSGNIAEAFRRRLYPSAFVNCLNIAEAEAAETQVWLEYSQASEYITQSEYSQLMDRYDHIMIMLIKMRKNPSQWKI